MQQYKAPNVMAAIIRCTYNLLILVLSIIFSEVTLLPFIYFTLFLLGRCFYPPKRVLHTDIPRMAWDSILQPPASQTDSYPIELPGNINRGELQTKEELHSRQLHYWTLQCFHFPHNWNMSLQRLLTFSHFIKQSRILAKTTTRMFHFLLLLITQAWMFRKTTLMDDIFSLH